MPTFAFLVGARAALLVGDSLLFFSWMRDVSIPLASTCLPLIRRCPFVGETRACRTCPCASFGWRERVRRGLGQSGGALRFDLEFKTGTMDLRPPRLAKPMCHSGARDSRLHKQRN